MLKKIIKASRPATLTVAILSTTLGIIIAYKKSVFSGDYIWDLWNVFLITLAALLLQSAINMMNNYFEEDVSEELKSLRKYYFLGYKRGKDEIFTFKTGILFFIITASIGFYLSYYSGIQLLIIELIGIFAAFPNWYATMFSGFYLEFLVVLIALITRGVAFEFRSKNKSKNWRNGWDRVIFTSSLILAILFGVALANLIKGVPIDGTMNYVGGFFDLISIYTLMAGITTLLVFTFHGAVYLSLKSDKIIEKRALKIAKPLGITAIAAYIFLILLTFMETDLFNSKLALGAAALALVALMLSWILVSNGRYKKAMLTNGLSIALGVAALFLGLFPRVMVSSISQ